MTDDSWLGSHTLVIPTYNRSELLEQILSYYSASSPQMPMLVLDSSKPEVAQRNAEIVSSRAPRGTHRIFPNTTPMAEKLALGLKDVVTPTASFCADDDLVFPAALASSIGFLNANPQYVSSHGVYINFREDRSKVHLGIEYSGPGIEHEHPGARIFRLMQGYESLFYGAFRTADLLEIFAEAGKIPSLHFQELIQSVAALVKGKVQRTRMFYAGRRSGPEAEPGRDRWQTYYWFADDAPEFVRHYAEYKEQLWAYYQRQAVRNPAIEIGRRDYDQLMDMGHAVYFSKNCPPAYFHSRLKHLWPKDVAIDEEKPVAQQKIQLGVDALKRGTTSFWPARLARLFGRAESHEPEAIDDGAVSTLDAEVARTCRVPRSAVFSPGWDWLAGDQDFRPAYLELCRYLDRSQN